MRAIIKLLILQQRSDNVIVHSVASKFCRYASYIVGIEWEMRGMEHWENEECYIVISNHQSSLDILGTLSSYKKIDKNLVQKYLQHLYFSKKLFRNV